MAEKFNYYVPFLAYIIAGSTTHTVPGHDYYVSDSAIETEDQIELMRQCIKEGLGYRPEYITLLDWKRIQ
jgi:hypothetical protein